MLFGIVSKCYLEIDVLILLELNLSHDKTLLCDFCLLRMVTSQQEGHKQIVLEENYS